MKKILIILLTSILVFSNTGCDSYLDVNENVDAPISIDAHLYLPGICASLQGIYLDIRALGPLTQMMGTNSYTTYANNSFSVASDAAGEMWRVVYWLHGINLENLINISLEKGDYALAGIGLTIKAFDWDMLVKYHGEVPFRQAFEQDRFSHEYDYQKDTYPEIRKMAYQAIKYIEMEEADMSKYGTYISANDYIYHGDMARWKKFAYAVLARNYISLSNKNDFVSSGFADSVIYCVNNAFASVSDDATLEVAGDGTTTETAYMNFWGVSRGNLHALSSTNYYYFQHEYAVQIMSGTVPKYDESNGNKIGTPTTVGTTEFRRWYPYELSDKQILTDTVRSQDGHFDPRILLLCATEDKRYAQLTETNNGVFTIQQLDGTYIDKTVRLIDTFPSEIPYIKNYVSKRYIGGGFTSRSGSYYISANSADGRSAVRYAPSFYGTDLGSLSSSTRNGYGRWLYRNGAPYILSTCAEMKFCAAEAYWKKGDKAGALQALQDGVARHMDFCAKYIALPNNTDVGGDKVSAASFRTLANEYLAGPYVGGLTVNDLTLSHIMMQKWVTLYPWGAHEAWVDMRKYHYDIDYTGDYPKSGNGWSQNTIEQKWDTDDTKIYKGFYLSPAQVQNRKGSYTANNQGSPCYRIRPRYNSEYMWNLPSLEALKPIPGNALNYHCSIPWFAFPGDVPNSL
jgi:hypothetical protein